MSMHRPIALTSHAPPPFRPNSPDPTHSSHVPRLNRRYEIARDQSLFGTAKIIRHRASDSAKEAAKTEAASSTRTDSSVNHSQTSQSSDASADPETPSREASQAVKMGRIGFGDEQEDATWGWPGLGTWPKETMESRGADESVKSGETGFGTWGWPGFGTWPGHSMQGEMTPQAPRSRPGRMGTGLKRSVDKASGSPKGA